MPRQGALMLCDWGRMIDVIIVDDEPAGRRTLREYCAQEADLCVIGEYGDSESAIAAIRVRQPKLLFLDIQMDPLNGIELARSLEPVRLAVDRVRDGLRRHAVEAFELNAVDYLLKPFDQDRFRKTLARVRPRTTPTGADECQAVIAGCSRSSSAARARCREERPRIFAEFDGNLHVIDVARVEMIESDRNYISHPRGTRQLPRARHAEPSGKALRRNRCCASAAPAWST